MRELPEIWGVAEICDRLRVSPPTVHEWRKNDRFPQPINLACGPVWAAADVRRFRTKQLRDRRKAQKF